MDSTLTVVTADQSVVRLVADFARGLGCPVDMAGDGVRIDLVDVGDTLLELLDYIALSATKVGIKPEEAMCRVSYRRGGSARVTLGLRLSEFSIES